MKFGFLSLFDHYPEDCSEEQRFKNFLDNAVYAETLGFDTVWIGEHHFNNYICPVPQVVAAALVRTISACDENSYYGYIGSSTSNRSLYACGVQK